MFDETGMPQRIGLHLLLCLALASPVAPASAQPARSPELLADEVSGLTLPP